jgi:hypothetical protein
MAKAATKIDKIAAQAAKPKIVRLKGKYSEIDLKATGKLPSWEDQDKLTAEQFRKRWHAARYFYYYHHDVKELRPFVVDVYGASWTKAQLKSFNKLKDWQVSPTLAAICKVVMDGANWEIETKAWADNKVIEILETGSKIADEVEKSEEPKKVINIQDRVRERGYDIIGDIEELLDKGKAFSLYDWLQKNEIPAMYATKIIDHYKPWFLELYAAATTNDADLNQAYGHMTKKNMKDRIIFFTKFLEDAERYSGNVKKARAPRKKKAPTTEKLLKNFQYQKESNEYKLQSCDPATIIGAQELWVFNTKYKTLGVYRARGPAGLTVKRTSIDGYDNDASLIKRIGRKPEEYVKKVLSGGKITLRKLMEEIKSEPTTFTDRINTNTVILKVVRQ